MYVVGNTDSHPRKRSFGHWETDIPEIMKYLAPLCIASLLLPGAALAADRPSGPYIGAGAGVNFAQDSDVDGTGTNTSLEHDEGYVGVLSAGYAFANGFRYEIEAGKRRNEIDSAGSTSVNGRTSVLSAMLNGYYDFATGTAFIPYLGAGIGAASVDMSANPVGTTGLNGSATGLGLQGIAGVGYQFNESTTGTLEYRYFTARGLNMSANNGASTDVDYNSHAVMLGVRFTFGAEEKPMPAAEPAPAPKPMAKKEPEPEPAPPPPAPPEVTRNYIVFFDWDSSQITPEAQAILREAAENARKGQISRIEATGHADRSGTQRYNLGLSERRAKAVQLVMAQYGVSANQIAVDWKGELQPLVPTADGVREPQNRRVEIVIGPGSSL